MKLNSENILTLDANKSYYIANSTGEIKEAGFWQKFKCFFGIGDGREKVQRLAEQVKAALLSDGGLQSETTLDNEIGALDLARSISGATLKAIASRFRADNADKVANADMGRFVEAKVKDFVRDHSSPRENMSAFRIHPDPKNVEYMTELARMAAKSALVGVNVDANTDKAKISADISRRLQSLLSLIDVAINNRSKCWESREDYVLPDGTSGRTNLPLPVMNELSFKVFASCLFKPDGSMIQGGLAGVQMIAYYPAKLLTGEVKKAILKSEVPMDLAKTCNNALIESFKHMGMQGVFSDMHVKTFAELRDEMATRYGSAVNKDARISSFGLSKDMLPNIEQAVETANRKGRPVSGEEIKDALRSVFCRGAAKMAINDFAAKLAAERNLPIPNSKVAFYINKFDPATIDDVQKATTPDEVAEALKRNEKTILSFLGKVDVVQGILAGLADKAIDRIAGETGMDRESVAGQLTTRRLDGKAGDVAIEIYKCTYPGCNEEGFSAEKAFDKVLDAFVKVRVDLLKEIQDEKNVSPACKDALRRVVLRAEKPDAHHIGQLMGVAASCAAEINNLKDALKSGDDASIVSGLVGIEKKINAKILEIYDHEKWADIGPDERDIAYELLMDKIVLDDEELAGLLQSNRGKIEPWLANSNGPLEDGTIVKKLTNTIYMQVLPPVEVPPPEQ